jgi:hypothetical protein
MIMASHGEIQPPLAPPADCERCKHRKPDNPGSHCYMFDKKPGDRCGQFRAEERGEATRRAESDAFVAQLREERRRRKAENFAKRQPKQ